METLDKHPVLHIQDLSIAYRYRGGMLPAVRDFSLQIFAGETYGLVGESGSGKTTLAHAIMRYLSDSGEIVGGRIDFDGRNLLALTSSEIRDIWGREIVFVPQDPLSALNPSIRVGEQVAEGLRVQMGLSRKAANTRTIELLTEVRISDPGRVARSYPHEISGGMQQRVMIAMALGAEPKLILLDEPTTSLDVTTQAAVLDLLRDLIHNTDAAVLYITHNLGVVAQICDRVAVLYAGELVEDAPKEALFEKPMHPYTQGLLASVPKLGRHKSDARLSSIPGRIPSPQERGSGCIFAPRCPLAIDLCFSERPRLDAPFPGSKVRCHRWPEIAAGEIFAWGKINNPEAVASRPPQETALQLKNVEVGYTHRQSLSERIAGRPRRRVMAVDGVDLSVQYGETLGLAGESGSGKTSLARAVVGLVVRSGGDIDLLGLSLAPELSRRSIDELRLAQYIFQNPEEALNPYLTIGETLQRPFITLMGQSKADARNNARRLLAAVKLPADYFDAYPNRLSGGEKQRVAIARAFATSPALLIADEPVSSLDVSVQASILNLLSALQVDANSSMLFISHDLAVVGFLADRVAIMYAGQVVEVTDSKALPALPHHPYTEALLSAVPSIDPATVQQVIQLEGDIPSQQAFPSGCRFHPRCPRYLGDICRTVEPPWQVTETGSRIRCHISPDDLRAAQKRGFDNEGG